MYLNCRSRYSLRWGIMTVKELVDEAAGAGVKELALTDINNTTGILDFIDICRDSGIKPIVGIEFRNDDHKTLYIGLAKNHEGFRELNDFYSWHSLNHKPFPTKPQPFENAILIFPFGNKAPFELSENEYIGIRITEANKLIHKDYKNKLDKIALLHPITFRNKKEYNLHRILRAIDRNTLISKQEPSHYALADEKFQDPGIFQKAFELFPEVLVTTKKVLDQCGIDELDLITPKNKLSFSESIDKDCEILKELAFKGMLKRYGKTDREAKKRIEHELEVIRRHQLAAYFLITLDIIQYAKSRGYHHVGRGSGANSIVSFCLGITDVDPIELNLFFERFINDQRTSPPDFDIDFSWDERDEIIAYILEKYGDHAAMMATVTSFQFRSVIREIGKVFGIKDKEVERILEDPHGMAKTDETAHRIVKWSEMLEGFPNHLGIHAGGILITEHPLTYFTPLHMMPKGFHIVQFDMHIAEDFGFFKYDILSQRGLGHIKEAVDLIKQNKNLEVDIHDIRRIKNDPATRSLIRESKAMGAFYVESPNMRMVFQKMKCDDYLSLVAASSIIRPGVSGSGMMGEYIKRYRDPDGFVYPHPLLKEILGETFGIMIYQEDVIRVAHLYAGLELSEADILRRIMSGKTRHNDKVMNVREKFVTNSLERGHPEDVTMELLRQIESFSSLSFCKAHSASYAVESFQSLYLKAHYPQEFFTAVINNFGGFYRTEFYVHEARRWGAVVEAPCINNSVYKTTVVENRIYLGFQHIKDINSENAKKFLREREANGAYSNLVDFISRNEISFEQVRTLVRLGVFRFTGKCKEQLIFEANKTFAKEKDPPQKERLFASSNPLRNIFFVEKNALLDAYDEFEYLGFTTTNPFIMLQTNFRGEIMANEMIFKINSTVRMVAKLVTYKRVRTKSGNSMVFSTFMDENGAHFDCTHFPPVLKQYPIIGSGFYQITGKVVLEQDHVSIEVEKLEFLPMKPDPRYPDLKDIPFNISSFFKPN